MSNVFLNPIIDIIRLDPEKVFCEISIDQKFRPISYGELASRANDFREVFKNRGIRSGDIIFLVLPHCSDLYSAFLGALSLGAIPTFLPYPNKKQESTRYWSEQNSVYRRSGGKLLVTYAELISAAPAEALLDLPIVPLNEVRHLNKALAFDVVDESDIALLQHSSGTTGLKKGVMLTYKAIAQQLSLYAERVELDSNSVIVSWLPVYHDMGLIACFLMPMFAGVKLISLDAFAWSNRPWILLEAVEQYRGTHVWLPNFALSHIARATPANMSFDLFSLRAIIACSEPNKPTSFDAFQERFKLSGISNTMLQSCYAMAETVFAVSQTSLNSPPNRLYADIKGSEINEGFEIGSQELISNGKPLLGVKVSTLIDGVLFGEGMVGEICVYAPFLFDGYFASDLKNSEFVDGMFRTGDVGFIWKGEIYISGRSKEVVIVNGRNVYIHDLETALAGVEGVKAGRICALGKLNIDTGSEQIVILAERRDGKLTDATLVSSINHALIDRCGFAAGDIRLVEKGWLIKTTSGKMSRQANKEKYLSEFF